MISFKEYIIEKRRNRHTYDIPETAYQFYRTHIDGKDDERFWFVSFRTIAKLGINPQSTYGTPNGIYTYWLRDYDTKIKDNRTFFGRTFPFASDYSVAYLFRVSPSAKRLDMFQGELIYDGYRFSNDDFNRSIDKLKDFYNSKAFDSKPIMFKDIPREDWENFLNEYIPIWDKRSRFQFDNYTSLTSFIDSDNFYGSLKEGWQYIYDDEHNSIGIREGTFENWSAFYVTNSTPHSNVYDNNKNGYILWTVSRAIAHTFAKKLNTSPPNLWNAILRKVLGIDVVVDHGTGIIFRAEPFQAVFLSKGAIDSSSIRVFHNQEGKDNPKPITIDSVNKLYQYIGKRSAETYIKELLSLTTTTRTAIRRLKEDSGYSLENHISTRIPVVFNPYKLFHDPEFLYVFFDEPWDWDSAEGVNTIVEEDTHSKKPIRSKNTLLWYFDLWYNTRKFKQEYESAFGTDTPFHHFLNAIEIANRHES